MALLNGFKLCWILLGIGVLMPPDGLAMAIEPMLVTSSESERGDPQGKQHLWLNLLMAGSNEDDSMVKVPTGKWPGVLEALQDEAFVKRLAHERLYKLNNPRGNAEDRSGYGAEWPMGALAMGGRPWTAGPFAVKKDTVKAAPEGKMSIKYHGTKKNAQFRKQYMSPCHFKICNMGRKRTAE